MVEPPAEVEIFVDYNGTLGESLTTHKVSQAAALVARTTGMDRRALYARAN